MDTTATTAIIMVVTFVIITTSIGVYAIMMELKKYRSIEMICLVGLGIITYIGVIYCSVHTVIEVLNKV